MPELPTVHRLRMLQDILADILSRPLVCQQCGKELDAEWLADPGPGSGGEMHHAARGVDPVDSRAWHGTYAPGTRPVQTRNTRSRYRPPAQ